MSYREGQRIRQARELARMSQTDLARRTETSQPTIARMERGETIADQSVLRSIARATQVPVTFFTDRGRVRETLGGTLRFREHSRLADKDRRRAHHLGVLSLELLEELAIDANVSLPAVRIPERAGTETPAEAARRVRAALGLDLDQPVGHLARGLERAGVRVFQLPADGDGAEKRVQAFSEWAAGSEQQPLLFVFRGQAGDRMRTSMAHELGHLTMHRVAADEDHAEREAFEFAGEFLLPAAAFAAELEGRVTLARLAELKRRWRVSIAAMVLRCERLGLIDKGQAKSLWVQISRRGWRRHEPVHVEPERPRLLRQLAERTYGDPPSARAVGTRHHLPAELVAQLINEQQPPTPVEEGTRAPVVEITYGRAAAPSG